MELRSGIAYELVLCNGTFTGAAGHWTDFDPSDFEIRQILSRISGAEFPGTGEDAGTISAGELIGFVGL